MSTTTVMMILLLLLTTVTQAISLDIRYPQFFHQSSLDSSVQITEGKSSGSFIAFLTLANGSVDDWSLNSTDADFQVLSNGFSYSLVTTQSLDRERQEFYQFTVDARHLVSPYEIVSKSVRIRLLDINDCVPSFNQSIYRTTLIPLESSFQVQATDDDEPKTDNSRISYSLANYQDLFQINDSTGTIECRKNLHTYERYEIIVLARDHGRPSLSSSTLVQIQLVPPMKTARVSKTSSWLAVDPKPENMLILAGSLAAIFVFLTLSICLICSIHYKLQRRRRRQRDRSTPDVKKPPFEESSLPAATIYDAIHIFPNTYYLPLSTDLLENRNTNNNNNNELVVHPCSSSSTSSPISGEVKAAGSDDGCYCSSDMSSDQFLLLNPSTLTLTGNKQVRFNSARQRMENLYEASIDPCASYV